jgi:hypothetical protein
MYGLFLLFFWGVGLLRQRVEKHNQKQSIAKETVNSVERAARMGQVDVLTHGYGFESLVANVDSCE